MAKTEPGPPPEPGSPLGHTCMVEGCADYGVFKPNPPDEPEFIDTHHPRSHYMLHHFPETEAEYARKLTIDKARRMAHYREHGTWLPPRLDA